MEVGRKARPKQPTTTPYLGDSEMIRLVKLALVSAVMFVAFAFAAPKSADAGYGYGYGHSYYRPYYPSYYNYYPSYYNYYTPSYSYGFGYGY
jgi:hypothetical protein